MTYLNNELQVRRELAERILKLEIELKGEKTRNGELQSTISNFSKDLEQSKADYSTLIHNVSLAALKIPKDHRRQIMNALPTQ